MTKKPFVTKEQLEEIAKVYPTFTFMTREESVKM